MNNPLLLLTLSAIAAAMLIWLFWPEKGQFWRWQHTRQLTRRILIEDALKHIHDCEYHDRKPSVQSIAGAIQIPANKVTELLPEMQAHNLITFEGDQISLTPEGRDYALHIIRAHRLWERHLADRTGYAEEEWHSQSERREHQLTPAQTEALAGELGNPRFDPHGDPIPTAAGELAPLERQHLPNFPLNQAGRIVHLEDEPETVYAQIVAEGLSLGMTVRVMEITPRRVRFWADGDEHILAPIIAANISVTPIPKEELIDVQPYERLNDLKPGESATVINLSQACHGVERRRLMDLGILSGTVIKAEMVSPSGDPTAYLIRGALIGLRKEQAGFINITREKG